MIFQKGANLSMALFFRSNFLMVLNSWSLCAVGLQKRNTLDVISMLIISYTSLIKIGDGRSQPLSLFLTSSERAVGYSAS